MYSNTSYQRIWPLGSGSSSEQSAGESEVPRRAEDGMMKRALKIVVQVVWAVSLITLGTWMGAAHGWVYHGWLGGFGVGASLAASPQLFLQLLH